MTAPVVHGYPDWYRVESRADRLYLNTTTTSTTVALVLLSVFVGDISYLGCRFLMTTEPASFELGFYADSGETILLSTLTIDVAAGGQFVGSIPVAGPYLRVRRILNGANANTTQALVYEASSLFHANHGSPANNVLLNQDNTAIGAGVTATLDTTRTWPGEAHVYATMDALSWNADVYSRDRSGTNRLLLRLDQSTGSMSQLIFLPPTPIRLVITNNDGSGHNYRFSLTARPMYPGV